MTRQGEWTPERERNRENRIRACECASRLWQGIGEPDLNKLWSAVVFFESYIETGCSVTREGMGILEEWPIVKLEIVP